MYYGFESASGARVSDAWTYRGLRTVILENQLVRALILADKGADIASLVHKPTDTEFLFRTPWGPRRGGALLTSGHDAEGAGFFDSYEGGWQTVLPNFGDPAHYRGAFLPLHGESSTVPWDVRILEEGPAEAAAVFGVRLVRSPIVVSKKVSIEAEGSTLTVVETVENVGAEPIELSYGHHLAFGPPFLSSDCAVDLPEALVHGHPEAFHDRNRLAPGFSRPWPYGLGRDGSRIDLRAIPPRDELSYDMAYMSDLSDGWYAITNRKLGLGIGVRYPRETFQYLWYWQMFGGGLGYPWWGQTYNIGLEPVTSWPSGGLEQQIANGSAWHLDAGERHSVVIRVTAYRSTGGVSDVAPDGSVTLY